VERWRARIPILISALVICVTVCSLTTYKAPTFAAPESTAVSSQVVKPKLMQKASTEGAVRNAVDPKGSKNVARIRESGNYADGVYYGSATGFRSTIKVKVVIKRGKIVSVDVVSHGDDAAYFNRARSLLDKIVQQQTTNVDTVSGATYSSTGLIKAVRNALAKAEKKNKKSTDKKKKTKTEKPGKKGQFPYPDGTYEGTAEGFCSDITVAVTLKKKTITKIAVVNQDEDRDFFNRALAVLKKIVKTQSTKVDVVSGATYSSKGLINATVNALKAAKAEADRQKKPTDPSGPSDSGDPTEPTDPVDVTKPTEPTSPYKDGIYSIGVRVYADDDEDFDDYDMTVDVTISEGKISGISIASTGAASADSAYVKRAQNGMKSKLIGRDDASGVDTVSGATCTSAAIIEACQQALAQAKQ